MHLSAPLQQPENRPFPGCSTASFAFPPPTEIALIGLDFSEHGGAGFSRQMGKNHLAQLVIEQDCRIGERLRDRSERESRSTLTELPCRRPSKNPPFTVDEIKGLFRLGTGDSSDVSEVG